MTVLYSRDIEKRVAIVSGLGRPYTNSGTGLQNSASAHCSVDASYAKMPCQRYSTSGPRALWCRCWPLSANTIPFYNERVTRENDAEAIIERCYCRSSKRDHYPTIECPALTMSWWSSSFCIFSPDRKLNVA